MYLCINNLSSAIKANKLSFENISVVATNILKERFVNPNYNLMVENKSKFELISYLFYNNAFLLEKAKLEEESSLIYQKGYEFSLSTLGDFSMLTNKFKPKVVLVRNIPKSLFNFNDVRIKTIDSKYDSDVDCFSGLDGNVSGYSHVLPKIGISKKNNQIPLTPIMHV